MLLISDYDSAIRLKPDYAEAYVKRGGIKHTLGQHFAAITDYDSAIRLKSDYAEAYAVRGMVKSNLGHLSEAKQDYQKALKLVEKVGDAHLKTEIVAAILEGLCDEYWSEERFEVIFEVYVKNGKLTKKQLKTLENIVREIK